MACAMPKESRMAYYSILTFTPTCFVIPLNDVNISKGQGGALKAFELTSENE